MADFEDVEIDDFFLACVERAQPPAPHLAALPPDDAGDIEESHELLVSSRRQAQPMAPLQLIGDVSALIELAKPLEAEAARAGIASVFDDGGFKTLMMCRLFGIQALSGKGGDDASCAQGRRYELKTVNLLSSHGQRRQMPGVTTEHTLTLNNIERYRATDSWVIGLFYGYLPHEVWQVSSVALEFWFQKWALLIEASPNQEINNPKIPWRWIMDNGVRLFADQSS